MSDTVYIIGAGASKEANLPTGIELKEKIMDLLNIKFDRFGGDVEEGDYVIAQAMKILSSKPIQPTSSIQALFNASHQIKNSLPQAISIDNLIHMRKDDKNIEICGKMAIVRAILTAEKKSTLFFKPDHSNITIDFKKTSNSWYTPFFRSITEDCGKDDLRERFKKITLIIFNYDRCVEYFLFHTIKHFYNLNEKETSNILSEIKIYHPYGSVGSLPWSDENDSVPFGYEPKPEELIEISKKIKTFTEGVDPNSSEVIETRESIENSDRLIFLGFAFHKLNMEFLFDAQYEYRRSQPLKCFATTFGISFSDALEIQKKINNLFPKSVEIETKQITCNELFSEFSIGISF